MVKRISSLALILLLLLSAARAESTVVRQEGEEWFPGEADWTYHFVYAYPHLEAEEDDLAAAMVNDTYQMVLEEMLYVVLPMFANAAGAGTHTEVRHDFTVTCNNGQFLSVLQQRAQHDDQGQETLTLESQVFDMAGEYLGETLTLRGLVMVGESSDQLAAAVMPLMYAEFGKLQAQGVCRKEISREEFETEFSPMLHFYADEKGNAVFFFPPALLTEPSFDVPVFPFTPQELESLLGRFSAVCWTEFTPQELESLL